MHRVATPSRRVAPRLGLALALLAPAAALTGCGPSSHDLYLEGLQIEGDAARNVCALVFDERSRAHVLDSDKVAACLSRNREALEKYEEAARLGQEGRDFQLSLEAARDRVARLETMFRTVRAMEVDRS